MLHGRHKPSCNRRGYRFRASGARAGRRSGCHADGNRVEGARRPGMHSGNVIQSMSDRPRISRSALWRRRPWRPDGRAASFPALPGTVKAGESSLGRTGLPFRRKWSQVFPGLRSSAARKGRSPTAKPAFRQSPVCQAGQRLFPGLDGFSGRFLATIDLIADASLSSSVRTTPPPKSSGSCRAQGSCRTHGGVNRRLWRRVAPIDWDASSIR